MYALFKDNKQISNADESKNAIIDIALLSGNAVEKGDEIFFKTGYEIKEAVDVIV